MLVYRALHNISFGWYSLLGSELRSTCQMNYQSFFCMFRFKHLSKGGIVAPSNEEENRVVERRNTPCNVLFTQPSRSLPISPRTSSSCKQTSSCSPSGPIRSSTHVKHNLPGPYTTPKPELLTKHEPSSLRPKVPAADRIGSWETPFSEKFKENLKNTLPPDLVSTLQSTIFRALAPNTRNSYGTGTPFPFCLPYHILNLQT
jgi:hypothetical protein